MTVKRFLTILLIVVCALSLPIMSQAHKDEAVLLWDENYDLYFNCQPGQYATTVWYVTIADVEDYNTALANGDATFWFADQHHDLWTVSAAFSVASGPNKTLIQYRVYSDTNHMVFGWSGVKFGDPTTDTIVPYRFECRNNAPDPQWVAEFIGSGH